MAKHKKSKDSVCPNCGSDTIQQLMWVEINTLEVEVDPKKSTTPEDFWCEPCEMHIEPITRQEYDDANQED